jgi:hypothetical protein
MMEERIYSAVQVDSGLVDRVRGLCPADTDVQDFVSVFMEKALVNALNMFEMLPNAASGIVTGSRVRLPVLPSREEIAAYCNAWWPDRPHPITVESVRGWERKKWIKRHPISDQPVRYEGADVVDFLNGKFKSPF